MQRTASTTWILGAAVLAAGLCLGGCKEAPLSWVSIGMESNHEADLLEEIDEITVTLDPDRGLLDAEGNPYGAVGVTDGLVLEDPDSDGINELRMSVWPDGDAFDALPTLGLEVEESNTPLPFTLQAEGFFDGELVALSPITDKEVLDEGAQLDVIITDFDLLAEPQPDCDDGEDNDGDGWIDDADPGCEDELDDDETDAGDTECSDGLDNDSDGAIDADDPDCDDGKDDSESPPPECDDTLDNDGDGWVDLDDPGCDDVLDTDEEDDGETECSDGEDNDGDGLVDAEDDGCADGLDDSESNAPCTDGFDNDDDGWTDFDDPGCNNDWAEDEDPQYSAFACNDGTDNDGDGDDDSDDADCEDGCDNDESTEIGACNNEIDDDADGWIDMDDPGCAGDPAGSDEGGFDVTYQCNDDTDNDADGVTDADDPDCADGYDLVEGATACTNGIDDDGDGWDDYHHQQRNGDE